MNDNNRQKINGIREAVSSATGKVSGLANDAKDRITGIVSNVKEKTNSFLDQDGDGKFDINDINIVGDKIVKGVSDFKNSIDEKVYERQVDRDNPVYVNSLDDPLFVLPKVVCILESSPRQKKYPGSIGYIEEIKNTSILCLFYNEAEKFGYNFYPSLDYKTMYYIDNSKPKTYSEISDLLTNMVDNQIAELEMIAYKLGAKSYDIEMLTEKSRNVSIGFKQRFESSEVVRSSSESKIGFDASNYTIKKINTKSEFTGSGKPERPNLIYFKNNSGLRNLIEMRIDGAEKANRSMTEKDFYFECKKTLNIDANAAETLDFVLKKVFDCKLNYTLKGQAENLERIVLHYRIKF